MKNTIKVFGIIALVAVIGFAVSATFTACDDGSGDPTPQTVTYSGTANGEIYTLKITEKLSRAAYAPQAGDSYVLTVGTKTSTGTVENVNGGNLTLKPSNAAETFTASVSNGDISGFTGSITFDGDTTPTALPSEVTPTPPSTGGGDAKTLVITGYPGSMEAGNTHFTSIAAVGTDYSALQNSIVAVAAIDGLEGSIGGVTISGTTATIQLKGGRDANGDFTNWTGSGTYDVWIAPKGTSEGSSWYKAGGVSFTQATTTIAASSFVFQVVQGPDGSGNNGGGNSALNGTWVNTAEGIKIVLNNGAITISNDNVEMMKGTCSTSGSNITITITQVTGAVFEASDLGITATQWYTQQQLKTAVIQALVSDGLSQSEAEEMYDEMFENTPFGSSTGTYTLSGNTLTITLDGTPPMVVTRQ